MQLTATSRSLHRSTSIGRRLAVTSAILLFAGSASATTVPQREGAPIEHLNLEKNLALGGYDPVAYFPVGGGKAKKGKAAFQAALRGVTYHFYTEKNRDVFLLDPEPYEPDYGGWCAWAMYKGDQVEVDPESFLVENGRLLVFYDGFFNDTRKSWLKEGGENLTPTADKNWTKTIGARARDRKKERAKEPKLGFEGNDPTERREGAEPVPGSLRVTTRLGDVQYRFASEENRLRFLQNPESFSQVGKASKASKAPEAPVAPRATGG